MHASHLFLSVHTGVSTGFGWRFGGNCSISTCCYLCISYCCQVCVNLACHSCQVCVNLECHSLLWDSLEMSLKCAQRWEKYEKVENLWSMQRELQHEAENKQVNLCNSWMCKPFEWMWDCAGPGWNLWQGLEDGMGQQLALAAHQLLQPRKQDWKRSSILRAPDWMGNLLSFYPTSLLLKEQMHYHEETLKQLLM